MQEQIDLQSAPRVRLLLSAALMIQSRAEEALPHLEQVLSDEKIEKAGIAEAARLYASAMYLLNRNSMAKYGELAGRAVEVRT